MNFLITGCTGIIGRKLIAHLSITVENAFFYLYAPDKEYTNQLFNGVSGVVFSEFSQLSTKTNIDYVIHLGEDHSNFKKKWSADNVAALLEDNRRLNVHLREYLQKLKFFPKRVVFGTTVDCYGYSYRKHDDNKCLAYIYRTPFHEGDFPSPISTSLPHLICQQNELFAWIMHKTGMNIAIVRMGIVLDRQSLMIQHYAKLLQMFRVGKIGCGYQPFNWVHSQDAVNGLIHILDADMSNVSSKIFNLVSASSPKDKTSFQDFCFCLSLIKKYKSFVGLPEGFVKLFFGEKVYKFTQGHYVYSENLIKIGYKIEYDTIHKALFQIHSEIKKTKPL